MQAPFPWFGGKSQAAALVWGALGDVDRYVEPFAGSLAVLLSRPHAARVEVVNDLDCYVANFWRATKAAPREVAHHANTPINEADLHARHTWLLAQTDFRARMHEDPDYFDAKVAAWWAWGACVWIGSGWCAPGTVPSKQLPQVTNRGCGLANLDVTGPVLNAWIAELAQRLRKVRVACGDWSRIVTPAVLGAGTNRKVAAFTGVLLDPPYADGKMAYAAGEKGVDALVREWAIEHGKDEGLRIVLCGYEGDHDMPVGWRAIAWKAKGGYGLHGVGEGRANRKRERLWLSPRCQYRGARSVPGVVDFDI